MPWGETTFFSASKFSGFFPPLLFPIISRRMIMIIRLLLLLVSFGKEKDVLDFFDESMWNVD